MIVPVIDTKKRLSIPAPPIVAPPAQSPEAHATAIDAADNENTLAASISQPEDIKLERRLSSNQEERVPSPSDDNLGRDDKPWPGRKMRI